MDFISILSLCWTKSKHNHGHLLNCQQNQSDILQPFQWSPNHCRPWQTTYQTGIQSRRYKKSYQCWGAVACIICVNDTQPLLQTSVTPGHPSTWPRQSLCLNWRRDTNMVQQGKWTPYIILLLCYPCKCYPDFVHAYAFLLFVISLMHSQNISISDDYNGRWGKRRSKWWLTDY